MKSTFRTLALPIAFLVIGLPVGIGVVMAMGDPEEAEKASDKAAFRSISTGASGRDDRRAEARWETLERFSGSGSAEESFEVARRAIQWRTNWRCESGRLRMTVGPESGRRRVVADTSCPDAGTESVLGHGRANLQVKASGDWRAAVRQQIDTPLEQPPLAGMTKERLLSRGRFEPIQKKGEGTVSLYRLANGRLALRYEDFYTSPSPGLELWLSEGKVDSTLDARRIPHVNAGAMRSTFGSYNQLLPRTASEDRMESIVIWCPTVTIAFAAAQLR